MKCGVEFSAQVTVVGFVLALPALHMQIGPPPLRLLAGFRFHSRSWSGKGVREDEKIPSHKKSGEIQ